MEPRQEIERVFCENRERLFGFCFRMLGHREQAEDVVQDVFLKACESGKEEPRWLFACARNRCLDLIRRRGVIHKVMDTLKRSVSWIPGFELEVALRDQQMRVLAELSPKMRSLLLMRVYLGLNYQELAQEFDTTPEAIGVMLSRARSRLRKTLSQEES